LCNVSAGNRRPWGSSRMYNEAPVQKFGPQHEQFLRDESRCVGRAEHIAFPTDEEDLLAALEFCRRSGEPVTVQGARTGITGGAVPHGGCILNLSHLDAIEGPVRAEQADRARVRVGPGVTLRRLTEWLQERSGERPGDGMAGGALFFPPDPTEAGASVGGMIACNASGSLSFRYGPVRRYVAALRVVLADGRVLRLRRGRDKAAGRTFRLQCDDGSVVEGRLPGYRVPEVKNAAGYYAADDMDMVDLFIGSEGTLGVIVEAELELLPAPVCRWGILAFLPSADSIAGLVQRLRRLRGPRLAALEYFDGASLELLRRGRDRISALEALPVLDAGWKAALYVEIHGQNEDEAMELAERVSGELSEAGVDEEATWTAMDRQQMARLRELRHAVPELVNMRLDDLRRGDPRLTKLGTDMAVGDDCLAEALDMYRHDVAEAGLAAVMFGHIGDNHIHVNILPRNRGEYERGWQLYTQWARRVVEWGGSISAEHGIGKLKSALLELMYGAEGLRGMRYLKRLFDPEWRLGRDTLFPSGE